ncbi:MAG: YhjD/YihY/BrkB family envelope integrity protein [Defluviicoccus sp.]
MNENAAFAAPIARLLWRPDVAALPRWQAALIRAGRIAYAVARDTIEGPLSLHAASLVYTTLLSFVPLLAFCFSVLKGFGVHNTLEPLLLGVLEPLGPRAVEITSQVISFIDRMEVGVLGALGLALLIYTAISVIQKIESAFNTIWHVGQPRSWARKLADYMSALLITPVLVFAAFSMIATVLDSPLIQRLGGMPLGELLTGGVRFLPKLVLVAVLAFVYMFMPNTKVGGRAALVGAVIAGLLWLAAGLVFATFVASAQSYAAIYSAFASAILVILWLNVNWLIVLIGAAIAYYVQHPEAVGIDDQSPLPSARTLEQTTLATLAAIAGAAYTGQPALTVNDLAGRLRLPAAHIEQVMMALERAGLMCRSADDPPRFLPAQPLEVTPAKAGLDAVRSDGGSGNLAAHLPAESARTIEIVEQRLDAARAAALNGVTIKDLAGPPEGSCRSDETEKNI